MTRVVSSSAAMKPGPKHVEYPLQEFIKSLQLSVSGLYKPSNQFQLQLRVRQGNPLVFPSIDRSQVFSLIPHKALKCTWLFCVTAYLTVAGW